MMAFCCDIGCLLDFKGSRRGTKTQGFCCAGLFSARVASLAWSLFSIQSVTRTRSTKSMRAESYPDKDKVVATLVRASAFLFFHFLLFAVNDEPGLAASFCRETISTGSA